MKLSKEEKNALRWVVKEYRELVFAIDGPIEAPVWKRKMTKARCAIAKLFKK